MRQKLIENAIEEKAVELSEDVSNLLFKFEKVPIGFIEVPPNFGYDESVAIDPIYEYQITISQLNYSNEIV